MPGKRIYYVPPRLVGPVSNWSGKDAQDGRSWLLDRAQRLGFDAVWFSPFFETTHLKAHTPAGKPSENSLYAIRDHGALDPEFSATKYVQERASLTDAERAKIDKLDREHIEHFMQRAQKQGLEVLAFGDLVFNHFAIDHPESVKERALIKKIRDGLEGGQKPEILTVNAADENGNHADRVIGMAWNDKNGQRQEMHFKFAYNHDLQALDWEGHPGRETAQINFYSPAAKKFFIDGDGKQEGFLKQVVDWYMDRGMQDFRCDVAYRVPPDWWTAIIEHAAARNPETVFMAETLGGSDHALNRMAQIKVKDANGKERPGFDLGMISNYWWNFTDDWLPAQEGPRLKKMAKFGGAAAPDNHDTPETLAAMFKKAFDGKPDRDKMVADVLVRNYAISAFIGNSVFMQMGYELSKETQNGVFKGQGSPKEWEDLVKARPQGNVLNIENRIREINDLKASLCVENCIVDIREHKEMQGGKLVKLACDYIDADSGEKKGEVILLVNRAPENGAVKVEDEGLKALEGGSLRRMGADKNPDAVVQDVIVYYTPPQTTPAPRQKPVPRFKGPKAA